MHNSRSYRCISLKNSPSPQSAEEISLTGPGRWPVSLAVKFAGFDQDAGDGRGFSVAKRGEKTAPPAGVAGDAGLVDQQQQTVTVAIDAKFHQALGLARAFTFTPQALARAREIA